MVERKQFRTSLPVNPELQTLLAKTVDRPVTEEDLREQRISFAYGNALDSDGITKDSVREASNRIMLRY